MLFPRFSSAWRWCALVFSLITLANYSSSATNSSDSSESRIYYMKKLSGGGCPYTASWLAHINLYRRIGWWMESTKMESASFNIFDRARWKFQLSDPDAYFVHHMSMFEHVNHKAYGFEVAKNKTLLLSKAAYKGECSNLRVSNRTSYLALIPFYGGLPPGVTADLSVKSIGQGNSLVDASTKALQCLATVCSCLKYFGNVVIGVARDDDRQLMSLMVNDLKYEIRRHITIIQIHLPKPAHLPFNLLVWGQHYIKVHNCHRFMKDEQHRLLKSKNRLSRHRNPHTTVIQGNPIYDLIDTDKVPQDLEDYQICLKDSIHRSHGQPINVTHVKTFGSILNSSSNNLSSESTILSHSEPIKFVYYTECDQVVYFDDEITFDVLSAASNESTFFSGRRKEKSRDSNPEEYMSTLNNWRECGAPGYSIQWPMQNYVQID